MKSTKNYTIVSSAREAYKKFLFNNLRAIHQRIAKAAKWQT